MALGVAANTCCAVALGVDPRLTLPETNIETQKGSIKTTIFLKGGYMGFHVNLGECRTLLRCNNDSRRVLILQVWATRIPLFVSLSSMWG